PPEPEPPPRLPAVARAACSIAEPGESVPPPIACRAASRSDSSRGAWLVFSGGVAGAGGAPAAPVAGGLACATAGGVGWGRASGPGCAGGPGGPGRRASSSSCSVLRSIVGFREVAMRSLSYTILVLGRRVTFCASGGSSRNVRSRSLIRSAPPCNTTDRELGRYLG